MTSSRLGRRIGLLGAIAAAAALTVAGSASPRPAAQTSPAQGTNVSIRLDFFHSETHAPFFAARDRGFWQRQGLNVTVLPGQGSASTVQQVAAGNNTFGWANAVAMTQQVARGADVVAIGSWRQVFDGGIAFWPDRGIRANDPKSLEGKTCAVTASGFIALLLPVYAQKAGIDLSKVNRRVLDPAVGNALFGSGQVDCYESTVVQAKYFFPPRGGVSPGILRYSDVEGMAPLGFTIIQNSRQLRGNPGLTARFLRGLFQGWNWACANPRDAVTLARQSFPAPVYSFEAGVNIWREVCGLARTRATRGRLLGVMAAQDWRDTVNLVRSAPELGVTQNVPPASTLYTNQSVLDAWSTLRPLPISVSLTNRALRLDLEGESVRTLRTGRYRITVRDNSLTRAFRLSGPGVQRSTSVRGTGRTTWTVTLRRGTYTYSTVGRPVVRGTIRVT